MHIQNDLLYLETHEWVKFLDEKTALVGLSDYAQEWLTDLVFITLPSEGEEVTAEHPLGDLESVKAVADIASPVTGTVTEVNGDVDQSPGLINQDPYGSWLVKISDITARGKLMDAAAYEKYLDSLNPEE